MQIYQIINKKNKKVEFSAKILQEQYLDGINRNTLERVYSVIKEYIDCSLEELINAIVYRTDITENLYWCSREENEKAIQALRLVKSNVGFKVDDFTDKRESIIFTGSKLLIRIGKSTMIKKKN